MEIPENVLILIGSIFGIFIGMWFIVTGLVRKLSGMAGRLNVDTGALLRESSWGSGIVNGARAKGCLRVAEYENGWVVRTAWLVGNGKLWLPRSGAKVGRFKRRGLFSPKSRTIICGDDEVVLYRSLGKFVE